MFTLQLELLQSFWYPSNWRSYSRNASSHPASSQGEPSELLIFFRYIPEGLQCSCGPDWYTVGTKYRSEYYTWFLFLFCFIVPLSLICFSYSQLLRTLRAVSGL